ncbi:MAG TPA: hypothetical protein ACQGQJ_03120 [Xylella fastidiosa subsp. multiplex]
MTNNTLTASLKKQNQAINDLQTEAKRRKQAATATMQQARQSPCKARTAPLECCWVNRLRV